MRKRTAPVPGLARCGHRGGRAKHRRRGDPYGLHYPPDVQRTLAVLDDFIAREIQPLEREHQQFFDHRRRRETPINYQ